MQHGPVPEGLAENLPGRSPIGANVGCFSSKLPQNRHPERSASQIYRVTERLWRGVEGPRGCLSYSCCSKLFSTEARTGQAPLGAFPNAEKQEGKIITFHERYTRDHQARTAADPILDKSVPSTDYPPTPSPMYFPTRTALTLSRARETEHWTDRFSRRLEPSNL